MECSRMTGYPRADLLVRKSAGPQGPALLKLQGLDSNQRPSGYEPDELPLLHPATSSEKSTPGKGLSSHAVAHAVLSMLQRFTTVFGMGTGGSTARYHQGVFNLSCVFALTSTPE